MNKVQIFYILSFPRSGSTLLGNLLSYQSNAIHVGELERFWVSNSLQRTFNRVCGCGNKYLNCSFWSKTLSTSSLGYSFKNWQAEMYRKPNSFESTLSGYENISLKDKLGLIKLYQTVLDKSNKEIVVDSSKSYSYLKLLLSIPEFEVTVIRLVRDPRAVINSRLRKTLTSNRYDLNWLRRKISFIKEVIDWDLFYGDFRKRGLDPSIDVKYEELTKNFPSYWNNELIHKLQSYGLDTVKLDEDTPLDLSNHVIQGNMSKLNKKQVVIKHDTRWKNELPKAYRLLINLLTIKQRKKLNY